jgi:secondary thiamine-phosphate synthase enzyme
VVTIWKDIGLTSHNRNELIDISSLIATEVEKSSIEDGFCLIFVPHTTAGITINENTDTNVIHDILLTFDRLVPKIAEYRHQEGNSDAHVKASLVGFSCTIPIISGHLHMGTWQGIYFCEFDGPRNRKIKVNIYGE